MNLLYLSTAGGALCALRGGVRRGGEAEESNPGGPVPGPCCGAYPSGTGDVHRFCGGHGGLSPGQ